jgi:hypothetical protein
MIGISIVFEDDNKLVLYPEIKQKYLLKSTLFSDTVEPPSRSFTFKIPAIPNQIIFNNLNKLDSRSKEFTYRVKVLQFGNFWKYALLQITDFNEDEYSVRVLLDRGYYSEFGQKSLREFDYNNPFKLRFYKSQLSHSEYLFEDIGVVSPATITISFVIASNPSVTIVETFDYIPGTDTPTTIVKRISERFNKKIYEYRYYLQPNDLFGELLEFYNLTTISAPSFYITSIVSSDVNFIINSPTNTTISSIEAYQEFYNQTLDNTDSDCVCFPVAAPNMYTTENLNYWGYLNFYNPKVPGNPLFPGKFQTNEQPLAPFPYLKNVMYMLHEESGIKIGDDQFFDEELSKIVFFNHEKVNNEDRLASNGWRYREMCVFFFNDIVPNISVSKLVNDFRYFFNTLVEYNSRGQYISIIPVKNILHNPEYIDWTSKAIRSYSVNNKPAVYELIYEWVGEPLSQELLPEIKEGQLGSSVDFKSALTSPSNGFLIVKATKENKTYKFNRVTNEWDLYSEDLYDYIPDNKNSSFKTGATPLFTIEYPYEWISRPDTVPAIVKWLLPYTKQQGNMFPIDEIPAPHRYMFYRMKNAPCHVKIADGDEVYVDGEYPLGTSHNYDLDGNKIGNYSLAWLAEDGLLNTFWKDWLDYLRSSSPVKMKFSLSAEDILNLDILKKIKIDNTVYFIDEIEFEVSDSIENCIATLYPLKVPFNE